MGSIELELSLPAAWPLTSTLEAETKIPSRAGAQQIPLREKTPDTESDVSGGGEKGRRDVSGAGKQVQMERFLFSFPQPSVRGVIGNSDW